MKIDINKELTKLLKLYDKLGIAKQIDNEKFYLYSIITHSTAIEGSTVTELENQLLFDNGISAKGRTLIEQMMNLDLKSAYDYGYSLALRHEDYSVKNLIKIASIVMSRTGDEYQTPLGSFSAARGDLRLLNVTAGFGGKSYMSYNKVPSRLEAFCNELNNRRKSIAKNDIIGIYNLSFWAHYELVTIHPWADGNGRICRLIMNMLQTEFGVLPVKVLKEDKADYIKSLIDTRENEDLNIFCDFMMNMHCKNLRTEIENYQASIGDNLPKQQKIGDKSAINLKIGDKKQIILDYITNNGSAKTGEIAELLNLSPSRTRDYLKALVDEGKLLTNGANKNRVYIINAKKR